MSDWKKRAQDLQNQSEEAAGFADAREFEFDQLGHDAKKSRIDLRRIARGRESLSAEQLRQGLQQQLAAQHQAQAAARPGGAMMAQRNAALQSSRIGDAMSGQAAIGGIQERQAAQDSLGRMLMEQRAQELQQALGARENAIRGYSGGLDAAAALSNLPSKWERYAPTVSAALSAYATYKGQQKREGQQ